MESRCDRAGVPVIQTAEPTAFRGGLGHGFLGTGKMVGFCSARNVGATG